MKKNLLLAVCAAVVTQGLCAEAALPVKVAIIQNMGNGYQATIFARDQSGQLIAKSKTVDLVPGERHSIKVPKLKYDEVYDYTVRLQWAKRANSC